MPTYPTPFGPINAPNEEARDKFIANEQARGAQATPQSGVTPQPGQASAAAQPGQPQQEETGGVFDALWDGLTQGGGNVVRGAGQLAGELGMPGMPTEGQLALREQRFENSPTRLAHPVAAATGEVLGEMAATAPLSFGRAVGPIANTIRGVVAGGSGGVTTPVTSGDYWTEKAKQTGAGAVVGGGMGAAGGLLTPRLSPGAQMLADRGVRLTPGQAGGWAESEQMMQAWPIMRNYVRGLAGRSQDDYNRATMAQALEPLGTVVPRNVQAGHQLMTFGRDQFNQAYGQVLPHVNLDGAGVTNALATSRPFQQLVSEMAPQDAARVTNILQNRVHDLIAQNGGVIDGQVFKTMEQDLGNRASSLIGTNSDEVGRGLRLALNTIRDELATQNPTYAPQLQRINHAYSMFDSVRDAAAADRLSGGRFTPDNMLQALHGGDTSAGKGAWGRGDVPMQALAEAAQDIIGHSGPISLRVRESISGSLKDMAMGVLGVPAYGIAQAGRIASPVLGPAVAAATPGAGQVAGESVTTGRYNPIGNGPIRRYGNPASGLTRPGSP